MLLPALRNPDLTATGKSSRKRWDRDGVIFMCTRTFTRFGRMASNTYIDHKSRRRGQPRAKCQARSRCSGKMGLLTGSRTPVHQGNDPPMDAVNLLKSWCGARIPLNLSYDPRLLWGKSCL